MAEIQLQKTTIKDIPILLSIEEKLIGSKVYLAETDIKEWEYEFSKNNSAIYLILKNRIIVGNISYDKNPDNTANITGLAIDPQFQKQGIGKETIKLILEELKDVEKIELATHPDNIAAIKIYSNFGFKVIGRKENYFGDGEPRIIMVKNNK